MRYKAEIDIISKTTELIWADPDIKDFTDHGINHSRRIIYVIDEFKKIVNLNDEELYILYSAAYLHDIGMQYNQYYEEKLSDEEIRSRHHELSIKMIQEKEGLVTLDYNFRDYILHVILCHRTPTSKQNDEIFNLEEIIYYGTGGEIRVRLLAAMFRLADELDITHERINEHRLKHGHLNIYSEYHWIKCYFVNGIKIDNGDIILDVRGPEEYKFLIRKLASLLESQIRLHTDYFIELFTKNNLRLRVLTPKLRGFIIPKEFIIDSGFWNHIEDEQKRLSSFPREEQDIHLNDLFKSGFINYTDQERTKANINDYSYWKHIALRNGTHTNCYIDFISILSEPENLNFYAKLLQNAILRIMPDVQCIIGIGISGTMLATKLSILANIPVISYSPRYQEGINLESKLELLEGQSKVFIVEDIIATGKTVLELTNLLDKKRIIYNIIALCIIPQALNINKKINIYHIYEINSISVYNEIACPLCKDFNKISATRIPL